MSLRFVGGLVFSLVALAFVVAAADFDGQTKGRFKKEGDRCVWDANDSGPNQCSPITRGRFKKEGDDCKWDARDDGPDQCRPTKGRFKKEGDACVWNATDSGPDQCNPRQPK